MPAQETKPFTFGQPFARNRRDTIPRDRLINFLAGDPDLADFIERARLFRRQTEQSLLDRYGDQAGSITNLMNDMILPLVRYQREFGADAFPLALGTLLQDLASGGVDPARRRSRQRSIQRDADASIRAAQDSAARSGMRGPGQIANEAAIRAAASNLRQGIDISEEQAGFERRGRLLSLFRDLFQTPALRSLELNRGQLARDRELAAQERDGGFLDFLAEGLGIASQFTGFGGLGGGSGGKDSDKSPFLPDALGTFLPSF